MYLWCNNLCCFTTGNNQQNERVFYGEMLEWVLVGFMVGNEVQNLGFELQLFLYENEGSRFVRYHIQQTLSQLDNISFVIKDSHETKLKKKST